MRGNYDISRPGRYTVQATYRFGPRVEDVALSQEIVLRVVPQDFLTFQMRRTGEPKPVAEGDPIPVEFQLTHAQREPVELTRLILRFEAGSLGKPRQLSGEVSWDLYDRTEVAPGSLVLTPGPNAPMPERLTLGQSGYRRPFDLSKTGWDLAVSSQLSRTPLWEHVKPGEQRQVVARLEGLADGAHFFFTSEPVEFSVTANGTPPAPAVAAP